jgi:hypothetical protein
MSLTDRDRFEAAFVYPGTLDEQAVERELAAFLLALRMSKQVMRLRAGPHLVDYSPFEPTPYDQIIEWISRGCVKRNLAKRAARAFRALRDAWHLRAALRDRDFHDVRYADPHATYDFSRAPDDALRVRRAAVIAANRAIRPFRWNVDAGGFRTFTKSILPRWERQTWGHRGADMYRRLLMPSWVLSDIVDMLFDAVRLRKSAVEAWLRPLFEAFVCGCGYLIWTDDVLYWVAKPTVHWEVFWQWPRLHHDTHAALESDIVNMYCWHGVMVPPFVILRPDRITIAGIDRVHNAEVRRAMIERYRHGEEIHGAAAFIRDGGGERLDHDERYGTLWRRNMPNDEPVVMIEVVNRTREPDGSFKRYWLRVPPNMPTAREAVAWTFNMPAEQYAPDKET